MPAPLPAPPPYASATLAGIVSTGTQTFAGNKTFSGTIGASNLSGSNTGDVTLGASTNGLSLSGQVLSLAVATTSVAGSMSAADKTKLDGISGSNTGDVTLGASTNGLSLAGQVLSLAVATTIAAGAMSSTDKTKLDGISGSNTGDVTLGAVGASPNSNGASLSGQTLALQPADGSNPGVVTTGTQTFAGAKTLSDDLTLTTGKIFSSVAATGSVDTAFIMKENGGLTAGSDYFMRMQTSGGTDLVKVDMYGSIVAGNAVAAAGNITLGGGYLSMTAAAPLTIKTAAADSGTANNIILDSANSFSTTGAKLVSVRNAGTEKAYIDRLGSFVTTGSIEASGEIKLGTGYLTQTGTSALNIRSSVTDGATANNVIINTVNAFTTTGAKLLSVRNSSVERFYVDRGGVIWASAGVLAPSIKGEAADDATAVGLKVGSNASYTTAGAKLLSVQNNTTEKVSIDKDGGITNATGAYYSNASASPGFSFKTNNLAAGGDIGAQFVDSGGTARAKIYTNGAAYFESSITGYMLRTFNGMVQSSTNGVGLTVQGYASDSGTALGVILNNANAMATSGAKLVSVQNAGTEKAYIDKDGTIGSVSGTFVSENTASPMTFTAKIAATAGQDTAYLFQPTAIAAYPDNLVLFKNSGGTTCFQVLANGSANFGDSVGVPGNLYVGNISPNAATFLSLTGAVAASGTAIAAKIKNANDLSGSAGAKIVSFYCDNGTTEKAYIDKDGLIKSASGVLAASLKGEAADGGSAVAVSVGSNATYSTSGAKLVSFKNNTTEKAYIDKDGWVQSSAGFKFPDNTTQTTAASNTRTVTTVTGATYTITTGDIFLVNAATTVTMPTAVGNTGRVICIKNITASSTVTVAPYSTQNIDGSNSNYGLTDSNQSISLVSDGSNWWII